MLVAMSVRGTSSAGKLRPVRQMLVFGERDFISFLSVDLLSRPSCAELFISSQITKSNSPLLAHFSAN